MENAVLTVSGLNEYLKFKIEADSLLSDIFVKGEISNFTNHKSGHLYFTLKDEGAVIRAVMFRAYASKLRFIPENGMKVILHGRVSVFVRDGQYQLYADKLEPDGIGALYLAFEQLKNKLEAEGLFSPEFKKPIPKYPNTVGIVTSPTGAAVRDMINISSRRYPLARLILFPCLVQGDSAPAQLCSGIRYFNERKPVDVIIIGRGGGSLEELWAFNSERLARTIFASDIPVISAVGHETDFSISDFVSDLRAPTPSAAIELALPETLDIKRRLSSFSSRIISAENAKIGNLRTHVELISKKRCLMSADTFIDDKRMLLLHLTRELEARASMMLERKQGAFSQKVARLHALNPLAVIARGYSAVFKQDGSVIKSIKQLSRGDFVTFRTTDGRAEAQITALMPDDNSCCTDNKICDVI